MENSYTIDDVRGFLRNMDNLAKHAKGSTRNESFLLSHLAVVYGTTAKESRDYLLDKAHDITRYGAQYWALGLDNENLDRLIRRERDVYNEALNDSMDRVKKAIEDREWRAMTPEDREQHMRDMERANISTWEESR